MSNLTILLLGKLQPCTGPLQLPTECLDGAGTLVGCLPNNFVAVNAGSRLGDMHQLSDLYDYKMLLLGAYCCGLQAFVL